MNKTVGCSNMLLCTCVLHMLDTHSDEVGYWGVLPGTETGHTAPKHLIWEQSTDQNIQHVNTGQQAAVNWIVPFTKSLWIRTGTKQLRVSI